MQLETDRMIFRAFAADDWRDLRLIQGNAQATDTLSADGKPFAEDKSREAARRWAAHWDVHGFGLWHITDKASGGFCAYAGLRLELFYGLPIVEMAYAVVPAFWRQGRGHEFARVCVDDVFERTGLSDAWCFTLARNIASQKVMQGAGFVFSHDGDHVGLPHRFYHMTRAQWVASKAD
ncbi:GNAT family N-acetyltransferase [Pyruvatibacter sp.]|uniref:GNAT family N-acetyltransferase n=1 Tax=Pyruvatibacter sp. TaxID=1981328 RepID=UPI0032EF696C